MKEFLSFGDVWGMLQGYVGFPLERDPLHFFKNKTIEKTSTMAKSRARGPGGALQISSNFRKTQVQVDACASAIQKVWRLNDME